MNQKLSLPVIQYEGAINQRIEKLSLPVIQYEGAMNQRIDKLSLRPYLPFNMREL